MTLETTTANGHQLETALGAGFDGDGHALLSCAGCGLLMSRQTAGNGFWQRQPCDGLGAKVVMIGSDSTEHYATIDMLPHDWNRGTLAGNLEPHKLFEEADDGEFRAAASAPSTSQTVNAAKRTVRAMRKQHEANRPVYYALGHMTATQRGPSNESIEIARRAAGTDAERAAVETLVEHWNES